MTEADFWVSLEVRLCRELQGMADRQHRRYWCDGLNPECYELECPAPCITGQAWICEGRNQEEWPFTFFLPARAASADAIDWAALLPPEEVTRWLTLDPYGKRIEMEPAAAVPDTNIPHAAP